MYYFTVARQPLSLQVELETELTMSTQGSVENLLLPRGGEHLVGQQAGVQLWWEASSTEGPGQSTR